MLELKIYQDLAIEDLAMKSSRNAVVKEQTKNNNLYMHHTKACSLESSLKAVCSG